MARRQSYLDVIAQEILAEVPEPDLPAENVHGLFVLYALLALAKGLSVTAEDVHNAWCAWMSQHNRNHPSLIPFAELDEETASYDEPFVKAICTIVRRGSADSELGAAHGA